MESRAKRASIFRPGGLPAECLFQHFGWALFLSAVGIDAILLLFDVGQLRVAPAGDFVIIGHGLCLVLDEGAKFLGRFWSQSIVAPTGLDGGAFRFRDIAEAAPFIHEIRLPVVVAFIVVRFSPLTGLRMDELHQIATILFVGVDRPDISEGVGVTARIVEGARRVEGLGQIVQIEDKRPIVEEFMVGHVARFIHGRPKDDGGVVQIALHDLEPFADAVILRGAFPEIDTPAGKFGACEIAEAIGPVVEAFFEDLLVEAGAIEAELKREFDVVAEIVVAWGGPDSGRVESLVEDPAQVDGFSVQVETVAANREGAHSKIGFDAIEDGAAVIGNFKNRFVEVGIFGIPKPWRRQGERNRSRIANVA